ncbi:MULTISPECIES: hypothetical protein [Methylotenera]|uniref:hypothetical protein n=1 Tax=Methylotenera TaxID=359407 RepID=UPI00036BA1D1|nr:MULTISPECIES: hypothetical protein [Methylotenera]
MKNFIGQLFGNAISKKPQAPFAWVDDLAEMEDIAALKFSYQQLAVIIAQMQSDETMDYGALLDLMITLEDVNFARLEKISSQFVQVENLKPELEVNISEACYSYCRQSYIAHLKIIEKVINPSKFKLENNMPVIIIGRAIFAAMNMMKWRMLTQANPPTKMWIQIYMLYRIASQQALLYIPVALFKLSPSTTLSAYFVQICMLGQLVQTNLNKQQVDIAYRVLAAWLTRAHISKNDTPEQYLFYIDLEKDVAAKRMRNFEANEQCRYWELDELEKQITTALTVTDRGEIPDSLKLAKIDHAKRLNSTLNIIFAEWTKTHYVRQRRKEERQATSKTAKVNSGILNICNQVLQANQINSGLRLSRDGKSFDERLRGHTVLTQSTGLGLNSGSLDTWIVTDESPHGLGTRVNKYANILARPDKLIGLLMDDDPSEIVIGIIRGVKPTTGNQLKVGIEIMSRYPNWVQLRQLSPDESFSDTVSEMMTAKQSSPIDIGLFSGIYLPIEAGLSSISTLILPKIHYRPNTPYAVNISGSPKHLKLGEPIESRDDWVKVAFPF